ncbi:MAG: translation initiation factor IF-2, partial [Candidatus Thermoplasmatota archaeon]
EEWKEKKKEEIEKKRREDIVHPAKFRILEDHVFRMSKPAIVGVRVLAGTIRPGRRLLNKEGRVLGKIKSIRSGEQSLDYAEQGDEVAIAVSGVTVGRQIEVEEELYIDIPEGDARELKDLDLTFDEERILDEIREIKQKEKDFWGF